MVVSVGQGRNVSAVAHHVGRYYTRDCKFVCGIGGIHPRGGMFNADHICRQLAKIRWLIGNLVRASIRREPRSKLAFMQNATVKQTLDLARKSRYGADWHIGDMAKRLWSILVGSQQKVVQSRLQQGVVGILLVTTFSMFGARLPIR